MKSSKSFFTFAALFITLLQSAIHAFAQPSTPRDSTWITNGPVHAVAYSKGLTYIGGDFTYVGPNTGYGAALSTTTGAPNMKFPRVNGPIDVVTPDGADGWYIGGKFTKVGDFTRNWIAHIKADGTVDPNWDPNPAGTLKTDGMSFYVSMHIYAIVVSGSTVYVCGNFTSIGGQQRRGIAALEASTGQATSWNPDASSIVRTLAIKDTTVYVGGIFDSIGGQSRKYLAAIDVATGNATAWNPVLNAGVNSMAISDSLLFVAGLFTSAGGQERRRLAAFDITNGQVTAWNPDVDGNIYTIAIDGTILYVGGNFVSIGGERRTYIAALSIYSSAPISWNPKLGGGAVHAIYLHGSTIYVGGRFGVIALDKTTGKARAWRPIALGPVRGLGANTNSSVVYAGGDFVCIGAQYRNRLAALDAATGIVTQWKPVVNFNGNIYAIAVSGSNVYIGGSFTEDVWSRYRIAAIDAVTGYFTAWNPSTNGDVYAITIDNATVYVGGKFTAIGGQTRNRLAALDINTGLAKGWNPNLSGTGVYTILANGATVYAGGDFYKVGDYSRQALAAIDANTGQVTAWNPNLNASSIIYTQALDGSTLYIGGEFNTVKGQTRNRLAAVDLATVDPTAWNPDANDTVRALALNETSVYAGGAFTSIGAQTRNYLAAINKSTGIPTDWNPNPNNFGSGHGLLAVGSAILAGGAFTTMGGNRQDYFAQFGNIVATNNPPHAPSAVNQYNHYDNTAITEGDTIDANRIVFKATISDPDDEPVKLQIELRKITDTFTGVPTQESNLANSGTLVSITTDILAAVGYKWRYRVMDVLGLANDWVEFGTPGNTDFVINSISLPAAAAYGNILGGDRAHKDKVTYSFPGRAGHIYLSYQAYDIDLNDEVKIFLNGAKITNVPLTSNNAWSGDRGAVLRDGLVNNTGANLLVFDNTKNPPGVLLWGVRQVSIENCFKLPSALAYGKIEYGDRSHADRVIYWFPGQTGEVNLFYEVYDIDDTHELDIIFNGVKIRDESVTANNGWSTIRTLLLPEALVNDTEANVVIFDNTQNPPNALNWGVRNLSIGLTSAIAIAIKASPGVGIAGKNVQGMQYLFDGQIISAERSADDDDGEIHAGLAKTATTIAPDGHLLISFPTVQQLDYLLLYPEENPQRVFCYRVEASPDGEKWQTLVDKTATPVQGIQLDQITGTQTRMLRISGRSYIYDWENIAMDEMDEEIHRQKHQEMITRTEPMDLAIAELAFFKQDSTAAVTTAEPVLPASFHLAQNFPNPFNPTTTIRFSTPSAGKVRLTVYNLYGEVVRTLVNGEMAAGDHLATFDGSDLASGIYFCRLEAGNLVATQKMILAK
ncbi:MAG: T9SS type A sorting domain-containing protein [bacterium]